jgi:hypothetical protein
MILFAPSVQMVHKEKVTWYTALINAKKYDIALFWRVAVMYANVMLVAAKQSTAI